jgi:hypothetical protein
MSIPGNIPFYALVSRREAQLLDYQLMNFGRR